MQRKNNHPPVPAFRLKFLSRVLPVIFILLWTACHKKAVPEISTRTSFPPAPKAAQLPAIDHSPETLAAGKVVYESRCNRCHELKDTRIYTEERWNAILRVMIPRAKLNPQETKEVTSYIFTNAKK